MITGKQWLGVLSAAAVVVVTGCSSGPTEGNDGEPAAGQSSPADTAETASGEAPADWQRIGGDESGFDLWIPPEWEVIDPAQNDSEGVREGFGLNGAEGELVKHAIEMLKSEGAEFAIDPETASSEYASNLESACTSGGTTGSDLESLKKKAEDLNTRLGAENLQVVDATVGDRPGIKVTYNSTSKPGGVPVDNTEVQVPADGDKYCYVNVRAKKGVLNNADEIAKTFMVN